MSKTLCTRPRIVALGVLVLAASWLGVVSPPHAAAACHIAAFDETSVTVSEDVGTLTLTVFLQGRQPSCEGTVDFETVAGTAAADEDFTATSGTLEFVADDDREETIEIAISSDDQEEGDEQFTVVLSNPTGGISGTSDAATVTISDAAGAEPGSEETATASEDATAEATPLESTENSSAGVLVAVVILGVIGLVAVTMVARKRRAG